MEAQIPAVLMRTSFHVQILITLGAYDDPRFGFL